MMKNFKNIFCKCASILCMVAMFVAMHSVNITCTGKYYQPTVPKAMDKFKKY